jgi:hypothetical protein
MTENASADAMWNSPEMCCATSVHFLVFLILDCIRLQLSCVYVLRGRNMLTGSYFQGSVNLRFPWQGCSLARVVFFLF